jgi:hypothetical protein
LFKALTVVIAGEPYPTIGDNGELLLYFFVRLRAGTIADIV